MALIFRNSIITPDGTELISKDRHDYVVYKDKNGQIFGIDGGNEYLRRTHDAVNCGIDTSITSDSKIEEIDGVSTLKYKYSKTVTLNTILKVNMEEAIL